MDELANIQKEWIIVAYKALQCSEPDDAPVTEDNLWVWHGHYGWRKVTDAEPTPLIGSHRFSSPKMAQAAINRQRKKTKHNWVWDRAKVIEWPLCWAKPDSHSMAINWEYLRKE
jgi:hypothetical protein